MKSQIFKAFVILILSSSNSFSQNVHGVQKNPLSISDVFFGDDQIYQVCYPKDHRNFFITIFTLSLSFISLLIVAIFNAYKKNKTLKNVNSIIENQNKELRDSIHYAQRIQNAILPKHDVKNAKVIYQPKDIVSGDLYWMLQRDNLQYFSVIDCTGHGVPGAFLSMLAHTSLNTAILEHQLTNPSEILHTMNELVKKALNLHLNLHIHDGMEVGICVLNTDNNTLEYAGAGIKLMYLNNSGINEIKAAKCTIGSDILLRTNMPKTHQIQLSKGDRIFMNSDGITDQFGHLTNKKYTSKRLRQILTTTADFEFEKQHIIIQTEITNWKGNQEQTDDMLMMLVEV